MRREIPLFFPLGIRSPFLYTFPERKAVGVSPFPLRDVNHLTEVPVWETEFFPYGGLTPCTTRTLSLAGGALASPSEAQISRPVTPYGGPFLINPIG